MPAPATPTARPGNPLLPALFWIGVGLAPLAAGLLLLGQSGGLLRVAAVLAVVSIVLIGLAVGLRRDPDAVRGEFEHTLAEEMDALRDDVRDDIRTAARATHAALMREIVELRDDVDELRGGAPRRRTDGGGHVPDGVFRHTETVQVTTRQTTHVTSSHPVVDGSRGRASVGRSAGYDVDEPVRASARPANRGDRYEQRPERPAIEASRIEPATILGSARPEPTVLGSARPEPAPVPAQRGYQARRSAPEPPAAQPRQPRYAPEPAADEPRRGRYAPDAYDDEPRPARAAVSPPPARPTPPRGDSAPRSRRSAEPAEVSPSDDQHAYQSRRTAGDDGAAVVTYGRRAAERPDDEPTPARASRRARRAAEPDGEPSFSDFLGPARQRNEDPWAGLRSEESWAEVRDDDQGRELRMGGRRAEVRGDEGWSEVRVEDRWASVRQGSR